MPAECFHIFVFWDIALAWGTWAVLQQIRGISFTASLFSLKKFPVILND